MEYTDEQLVRDLGSRIGYGNMMHIAERLWRADLERIGCAGGEFVVGQCRAVHDAETGGAAALEAALASLLETVPTCGHDDCHRDAFTSVRVDGRTPSNPGGWYRAWFCDEHIPAHVSECMTLNRMRAAVEAIRERALLGAGEGVGG